MSNANKQSDAKLKGLLVIAAVVAVVVTVSLARSVVRLMTTPAQPPAAATGLEPESSARRQVARRLHQAPSWQPRELVQRRARKEALRHDPDEKPFRVAAIGADAPRLRAVEMAALREDIAANSADDETATPSEEEIAEMERKGVMVW